MLRDKVRKTLWSRSGNRCALCRCELTIDATDKDEESIVGEECHVISSRPNGPRYDSSFPAEQLDEADNLILLCRVHHRMIDDQTETYTADTLRIRKKEHEQWVCKSLGAQEQVIPTRIRSTDAGMPKYLKRLMSGQDTASVVGDTCAHGFEHDELCSEEEVELVATFLQELENYGDIWDGIGAGGRVEATFRIGNLLKELDNAGFWVFGARETYQIEGGNAPPADWPIGIIRVVRQSNPEILKIEVAPAGAHHEHDQ